MKRSGPAGLKLMGGSIPTWLFDRMTRLSLPIVETILMEYGKKEFLRRNFVPVIYFVMWSLFRKTETGHPTYTFS